MLRLAEAILPRQLTWWLPQNELGSRLNPLLMINV
jgi:hypothetical protein